MDRTYIREGSLNRASVCKSVFSSLQSRFIMGCLIDLGALRAWVFTCRWIMGYGGKHGVWGWFYIDKLRQAPIQLVEFRGCCSTLSSIFKDRRYTDFVSLTFISKSCYINSHTPTLETKLIITRISMRCELFQALFFFFFLYFGAEDCAKSTKAWAKCICTR